jgi:hypothetical protein
MYKKIHGLIFFLIIGINQLFAQLPPLDQRIVWNPGIPGGIPDIKSPIVNVLDFGADPTGNADSYKAFLEAVGKLPGSGGVVLIPEGTYRINKGISISRDNIVFRGTGRKSKLIMGNRGDSFETVRWEAGNWQPVLKGFEKDSKIVFVQNGSVFTPGGFAEIEQDNNPAAMYTKPEWKQSWANNAVGQLFEIEKVSGNEVALKTPLHTNFSPEFNVRIRPVQMIVHVGFENFYIEKTVASGNTFSFQNAARCWISQIESNHTRKAHVTLNQSLACTVRESYFHHSFDYGGGGSGYGVECGTHTSDVLVEDNVFDSLRHSMLVQIGANGNVYGYNYSVHTVQGESETNLNRGWIPPDISIHGHYTFMNLFEGNDVEEIGIADYWGPAGPGNTFFRNRVNGEGIFLYDISLYQNIIGNLSPKFIDEKKVASKNFIHGNVINNSVIWSPGISKELPPSLYIETIPSFLSKGNWPVFGPEVSQSVKLPARIRYEKLLGK